MMAGVEAHVIKFADRMQVHFECQIRILLKELYSACARPTCPEITNNQIQYRPSNRSLTKREAEIMRSKPDGQVGVIDVTTDIYCLDVALSETLTNGKDVKKLRSIWNSSTTPRWQKILKISQIIFIFLIILRDGAFFLS